MTARQKEVLDTLEIVFGREGLNVTVAELARRVKCSRRTLYQLAPTKDALLLLVLDRRLRRVGTAARAAAAAERLSSRQIEAFLRAAIVTCQASPPNWSTAIASYPPAGWLLERHMAAAKRFIARTIERGIASGELEEIHAGLIAEGLVAVCVRLADPRFLAANEISATDALQELFRVVDPGISSRRIMRRAQ